MRAFDQTGNIGDYITFFMRHLANGDYAQVGLQRGERIVSDFWLGSGDARDQSRFADVWIPHQANIRQQLQLQTQDFLFTGEARLMLARGLVRAGGKVLIAASAAPAMRHNDALIGLGEIMNALAAFFVIENGANGYLQHDTVPIAASAVGALAMTPALRFIFRIKSEVHQRVVAFAGFHDYVAAAAAIAARGPAARNKFLPAKRHAAVAAVAGLYTNYCLINEHACI